MEEKERINAGKKKESVNIDDPDYVRALGVNHYHYRFIRIEWSVQINTRNSKIKRSTLFVSHFIKKASVWLFAWLIEKTRSIKSNKLVSMSM